jgi:hypothetical protein
MTAAMFNTNVRDNVGEAWRRVGGGGPTSPAAPNGSFGTLLTIGPITVDPGVPVRLELAAHMASGGTGGILSVYHATDDTELTRVWETSGHVAGTFGSVTPLEHEETPEASSVTWRVRGFGYGGACTFSGLSWILRQRGGPG